MVVWRGSVAVMAADKRAAGRGRRIRGLRRLLKLTQKTVSKDVGITEGALRSLEAGRSAPRAETLQKLCGVLRTSADYILFGVVEEAPDTNQTAA